MWAEWARHTAQDELTAHIETMSARNGYTISREEIVASTARLDALISDAATDDSLTDDELEMVSAGGIPQSGAP